jgi:hypothetical protein
MRLRAVVVALATLIACAPSDRGTTPAPSRHHLFVFAGDTSHHSTKRDFLAVIDADTASPAYATVVATVPVGDGPAMAHHIEFEMPAGGRPLVGNTYMSGRAYLFDLADPLRPRAAGAVDSVPGLRTPHSFARLADGNVLATMQFGDGRAKGDPGGLALFSPEGRVVRQGSSADPAFPGAAIRTYALDVAPRTDRVLTTSSPMDDERTADVVQLWRLSDLTLLRTLAVPQSAADSMWHYPFEVRFLDDGRSAFLNTFYCAFYHLSGLDGDTPTIERVFALEQPKYTWCGVPLRIGQWWIMPVTKAREYVVLDISDPRRPRIASALATDSTFFPHWMSREPGSDRIVVSSDGPHPSVRIARFDSTTGRLAWDERFRETPNGPLGVSFVRESWPHGAAGYAAPHGAVFSRAQRGR